jgi:hypothetical protein
MCTLSICSTSHEAGTEAEAELFIVLGSMSYRLEQNSIDLIKIRYVFFAIPVVA